MLMLVVAAVAVVLLLGKVVVVAVAVLVVVAVVDVVVALLVSVVPPPHAQHARSGYRKLAPPAHSLPGFSAPAAHQPAPRSAPLGVAGCRGYSYSWQRLP